MKKSLCKPIHDNASLKRCKGSKIFVIYCDSCKKHLRIHLSARMQACIRRISDCRTFSNIPTVLEIIVNVFSMHFQS